MKQPRHWLVGLLCFGVLSGCSPDLAELRPNDQGLRYLHPYPQPRPGRSPQWTSLDGSTTYVSTAPGLFPESNPYDDPPGTNFINNVNSNMFDGFGREMPNTLPSTPERPYNLIDGDVITSRIARRSPTTDLHSILRRAGTAAKRGQIDRVSLQEAVDIIEGNAVFPDRTYNGFPLLHYNGPNKVKQVKPIYSDSGELVGGAVNIHQIWYDSHIESDTAFIDPSKVFDVPWTVTYTIDVLEGGSDDFSPFVIYVDDPFLSPKGAPPRPLVAMDAAFYPMDVGTRNIFKIKMSRGKYFNLIYNWGWRIHAPRVQVLDNARKVINGRRLPDYQRMTFGKDPLASRQAQLAAIAKIGEMAPAKRMWRAFRDALASDDPLSVLDHLQSAEAAFDDWKDRTKLPAGVERDPDADLTLFYVNNTIYGEIHGGGIPVLNEWKTRPQRVTVTLLNGDHFVHGYANVDFGGNRGWENQFQSTLSERGVGPFFTFGRVHWWPVAGGPWGLIDIPPVADGVPGRHRVVMDFNFDPARRLRFYQFDPYYHDVAVFSIH